MQDLSQTQNKGMVTGRLEKDDEVIVLVLQTSHKWVYVSFTDPEDNFSQTSWMLKKTIPDQKMSKQ